MRRYGDIMPATKKKKLVPKQERFCQEYMIDLNATRAYQAVYGCTYKSAKDNASRTIAIDSVQERIASLKQKAADVSGVTQQMVIDEYKKIAFANIKDYIGGDNTVKDISQLPDEIAAAVESIQCDTRFDGGDSEGYVQKVKFKCYDKLKGLNDLGRHLGLFEKDNSQKTAPLLEIYKDICGNGRAITISGDQSQSG